ncbi:hypothetical protein KI688_001209 [Linnemannia hyalina]|uniref:Uncharacterized protein n=1 Tax=Linnemannia hyalina TaxID=64524 RepID=A0A9P8BRG6_9FUNG|nr:hypothetical protein KI688_001209 [Linnemannia hyalina]
MKSIITIIVAIVVAATTTVAATFVRCITTDSIQSVIASMVLIIFAITFNITLFTESNTNLTFKSIKKLSAKINIALERCKPMYS